MAQHIQNVDSMLHYCVRKTPSAVPRNAPEGDGVNFSFLAGDSSALPAFSASEALNADLFVFAFDPESRFQTFAPITPLQHLQYGKLDNFATWALQSDAAWRLLLYRRVAFNLACQSSLWQYHGH